MPLNRTLAGKSSRRRFLQGAGATAAAVAATRFHAPAFVRAQEKVTLTWVSDLPSTEDIVKVFTEKYPNIEVQVERVTFREVFQQNQTRLGSGSDTPDIVSVDAPLVASYGSRGWLSPLDQAFTPEQLADIVPALVDSGKYNGSLLAPPIWNSSQLFYYNLDLLEAAGVTPPGPEERWTWDQVHEAAQKVTSGDVFGFQFEQYNRIYQLQPLPQGKGAKVIGDDGLTVEGIINSQEWVDAFQWFSDIHNKTKVAPQGNIDINELFVNQKLAMAIRGPWAIKTFMNANLPFRWRAAPNPYWGGDLPVTVPTDSWHVGVNVNSKHQAEAIQFVQWITSAEAGTFWYERGDNWPSQVSLLDKITKDPANADWPGKAYAIAAIESGHGVPRPLTVGYQEYEDILSTAFEDIRNGSDVKESLDNAARQIEREMQKYR
ncbi:MAG: multiple sugar transport system substrate-binding protein [Thermomicrobiales bacterium]|nr:multiple sugar transport system substrate-binding protein [Thermomicrobiales bacterium]